jgi:hypothetical protein
VSTMENLSAYYSSMTEMTGAHRRMPRTHPLATAWGWSALEPPPPPNGTGFWPREGQPVELNPQVAMAQWTNGT